ncbi:axonemal dynein light intermediate polypeptide 1-like [Cloeon dipterum]|uniref:axonemal dynein light intermediate polypeptide 1-like n=1 Tax=Cloeon dipterum TaxID=197152 RepID=UPI00322098B5
MSHVLKNIPESLVRYAAPTPVKKPRDKELNKPEEKHDVLYRDIKVGDEVLDILLPPRVFVGDNLDYYVQKVHRAPATEREIERLRIELDRKLFERGARMSGPCVIRRELLSQALDELIREESIACAETGILMAAWRDHCVRTLKAYEDLYVSRLAHENQKYLKSAQSKCDLQERLTVLKSEIHDTGEKLRRARARLEFSSKARDEAATKERNKNNQILENLTESTEEGMKALKAKLKAIKTGV